MKYPLLLLTVLLLFSQPSFAVTEEDWFGEYLMNFNGTPARLLIGAKAKSSSGPTLPSVTYIDPAPNGRTYGGQVEAFDHDFQHMIFFVQFEDSRVRFDAYLFVGDKDQMAGMAVLGGSTLGFVARRESRTEAKPATASASRMAVMASAVRPAPTSSTTSMQITIDSNGVVTLTRDGAPKRLQPQIALHRGPQGGQSCDKCDSATSSGQPSIPQPEISWFTQHGNALLEAIRAIAADQVNNQVNWENNIGADLRLRVDMRTDTLRRILLLSGQQ